ncbi:hypothetical protein GCM10010317_040810 [Streptomyces mirabilis]|nr:hypothetical protein GCM10010317_040810 [Streptomyces mirabilis]
MRWIGGVLQVGGGHPADLPRRLWLLGPQQAQAQGLVLEEVVDVHVLWLLVRQPGTRARARHLTFTRYMRVIAS